MPSSSALAKRSRRGRIPGYWPWIRLYDPLGALVAGTHQYGALAAQFGVTAGLAGTYTVRVASADAGNDALGAYVLRLAKVPGAFSVGDQGGALGNGGNHPGRIEVGDLDMWTFTAGQNETAVVSIGEVPVGTGVPDPGFWPWIRIYGPLGAFSARYPSVRRPGGAGQLRRPPLRDLHRRREDG